MNVKENNLKEPLIKKLKTNKNYYIYDVNSNEIIKVNEIIYNLFDDFNANNIENTTCKIKHNYKISEIEKFYKIFKKSKRDNNYFSNHRPDISFETKSINDIKLALSSNLRQLTLAITENCNQRCKYCTFSGRYTHSRTHRKKSMSFKIAKKAIDYFIRRSGEETNNIPKANISFYGGEPLLEFELIKRIISYIKQINEFDKYRFSIATNGTRFTKPIIKFFAENNIFLQISLDGPEDLHNRYRVFANGKKTFDAIMDNLDKICEHSNEYFENHISFSSTLTPPYDFEKNINFFFRNSFFKKIGRKSNFSAVDPYETTFFDDFGFNSHRKDYNIEINKLYNRYKNALIGESYNDLTIEGNFFDRDFLRIDGREMKFLGDEYPPQGTCFPGQRKLFVNTDGNFYMCEKVNNYFEIGNVFNGFNYGKIYDFLEKYIDFFKDCRYCWALRFCQKCFNNIRKGSDFDERRRNDYCRNSLYNIEKTLRDYCEIREKNVDAFKILDHMTLM